MESRPPNGEIINAHLGKEDFLNKGGLFSYMAYAYIVLDVGRLQELFPFLGEIHLIRIIGVLAVIGLFMNLQKIMEGVKSPQFKGILGITFLAIFTIPFSIWPGNSLQFLITYYWKTLLIFLLIVGLAASLSNLNKVVWAILIAVGFLGVFSVLADIQGVVFAKDRLYVSETYDANDLAMVMIVSLPFVIFGFIKQKGLKRLVLGGLTALIIMTVILTISRGGFLGFLGVSLAVLIKAKKIAKKTFVPMVALILSGSTIFIFYARAPFWERISSILTYERDYNVTSYGGRVEIWKRGIELMLENPITGVGIDGFTTAEGLSHRDIGGKWSTAHNSFIQIGAELGFVGLFLFCYIIWVSLRDINRINKTLIQRNEDHPILFLLGAIQCSWIGYIIGGFFLSAAYTPVFYFLVGVSAIVPILANQIVFEPSKA